MCTSSSIYTGVHKGLHECSDGSMCKEAQGCIHCPGGFPACCPCLQATGTRQGPRGDKVFVTLTANHTANPAGCGERAVTRGRVAVAATTSELRGSGSISSPGPETLMGLRSCRGFFLELSSPEAEQRDWGPGGGMMEIWGVGRAGSHAEMGTVVTAPKQRHICSNTSATRPYHPWAAALR